MLFYLLSALGLVPTFQKTKCKKLLNITMERIKLLEKRRQARVRQLYRDVIEILQLKKEHKLDPLLLRIWKELCLFFVYTKITEYCGFVQINLKDITGQRECPSGLEEPLAGLCFAASCCADLPELQELREIFAMKYGKQIVSSGQDLKPNGNVNEEFLDCLYTKDPSEARKQALLEETIVKYNAMQGHEQDTLQQELCDSVSTEGLVDANDCNQSKGGIDYAMNMSEVKHQSEYEESQGVDVVQEPNHIETVCKEDLGSRELGNELANRKRTLEDTETRRSAFKRAYRKRKFWLNKAMEGEENGGKEHEHTADKAHNSGTEVYGDAGKKLTCEHRDGCESCGVLQGEGITAHMNKDVTPSEDLRILHYIEKPLCSQPPQRPPPPPPPPKRAPPPPPSLRVISMPSAHNDKQVNANTSLPRRCSTMANDYYLETYGSHVHPRLPKYEDLVANFTALKG